MAPGPRQGRERARSDPSLLAFLEVLVEPGHHALDYVTPVLRLCDQVAFVGVDHKLRFHPQGLQGVPKLIGLWHRGLAITVAYQDQRRRLDVLDEGNW